MVEDINNRILEGIAYIRGKRNRPNYNTILSFLNRGNEYHVNIATLKNIIEGMLSDGIILDKGKKGAESFYLKEDSIDTEGFVDNSDSVVLEKVFDDIDESFHNVIFEKIRTEVKSQLTPLLSEILKDASFMNEVKSTKQVNINYDNDAYVNVLKEIISHLNEQITKKDNVIELLINKISTVKNVESFNAFNDVNMQDMDNDVFFNIDEKQTVNTANNINVNKQRKYKTKKEIKDAIIIQDNNKGENILTNVIQEVSNIPLSNLRETLGNNENNT